MENLEEKIKESKPLTKQEETQIALICSHSFAEQDQVAGWGLFVFC